MSGTILLMSASLSKLSIPFELGSLVLFTVYLQRLLQNSVLPLLPNKHL